MESMKTIFFEKENDFSQQEFEFNKLTQEDLLSKNDHKYETASSAISIIIPSYVQKKQIPVTLESLMKQKTNEFEVVLVDDGSKVSILSLLKEKQFPFDLKYVKVAKNSGINNARNIGILLSENENILLLDNDLYFHENFVNNFKIKLSYTKDCIFIGFRENSELDITKLAREPSIDKDWRYNISLSQENLVQLNLNKKENINSGEISILKETNYLKNLTKGESLAYWDLPCMVIGHTLGFKKSPAMAIGGFPQITKGWGMDDIAFGLSMIVMGQKVIPANNCISFHQICNSDENKVTLNKQDFYSNVQRYFEFAEMSMNSLRFPSYKITHNSFKTDRIQEYFAEVD